MSLTQLEACRECSEPSALLTDNGDGNTGPSGPARKVEVAAVGRLQRRDERRPPPRREAGRAVESAEAGEAGVDHPELAASAPGQLVALDVAGDVAGAGQEAGVVLASGSSFAVTAGTSTYSQTWSVVPTASRVPSKARPMGAGKPRKWVLSRSPSSRTITSFPAW